LAVPPPPHTAGEVHTPQVSVPPQPSPMMPQLAPLAPQVVCLQMLPHWFGVPPPPQLAGAVQVPQSSKPPQPSATWPQVALAVVHVFFLQLGGGGGSPTDTHADKSKIMNSSTFSCGVSAAFEQWSGKT
jgi:hypothetical protein